MAAKGHNDKMEPPHFDDELRNLVELPQWQVERNLALSDRDQLQAFGLSLIGN